MWQAYSTLNFEVCTPLLVSVVTENIIPYIIPNCFTVSRETSQRNYLIKFLEQTFAFLLRKRGETTRE